MVRQRSVSDATQAYFETEQKPPHLFGPKDRVKEASTALT
jgi:hypothetical protein